MSVTPSRKLPVPDSHRPTGAALTGPVVRELPPPQTSHPAATPTIASSVANKIYVLFTVDVETRRNGTLDRDVWGRLPNCTHPMGIEWLMDAFDRHNVRGTFFVNVYEAAIWGRAAMAGVCRAIDRRGHDLGLHTHPRPMFRPWGMSGASRELQEEILRTGLNLMRQFTAAPILAHRAGACAADSATIAACRSVRIPMDFSLNPAHQHHRYVRVDSGNVPRMRDGVFCVPVTCHSQLTIGPWRSLRICDLESSSSWETIATIEGLRQKGVRVATVLLHSFSLIRFGRPNHTVDAALERLLAAFTLDPNVELIGVRELYEMQKSDPEMAKSPDFIPDTGLWLAYHRAWRRINQGWKNVVVALAPLLAAILITLFFITR